MMTCSALADLQRKVARPRRPPGPEAIEWTDYPRIPPGEYSAFCAWAKKYYDQAFKRWTCLLRFDVLQNNQSYVFARIPMWLPLGNGEKPRASRRGKYLSEWEEANDKPPSRGDRLSNGKGH
jgi:hypothetical protein